MVKPARYPKRTTILVTRNPFEIFMLVALVLSGTLGLLPHKPTAVDLIASTFSLVWYSGLILGGSVALLSQWAHSTFGILLERAAMWLLAGLMTAYGIGIYILLGWGVIGVGGALVLALGLACFMRGLQIRTAIRAAVKPAEVPPSVDLPAPPVDL